MYIIYCKLIGNEIDKRMKKDETDNKQIRFSFFFFFFNPKLLNNRRESDEKVSLYIKMKNIKKIYL